MNPERRQLALLVGTALRMDFRPRGAESESRLRRARPLLAVLLMYGLIGTSLGMTLAVAPVPLFHKTVVLYAMAAMLLMLNLMVEYQEILFSPLDSEVLGWRPIASGTLYRSRVLHVLVYVTMLTVAQLVVPCVVIGWRDGGIVVAGAFAVGAFANALFATAVILVVHGMLLRRLSPDRFQDVLGSVQLGFMVAMLLGYQLLTPRAVGAAFGDGSPVGGWLRLLPPGWFASLPALAAGRFGWGLGAGLLAGAVLLAAVWSHALRRLAPGYAIEIESVRVAAGSAHSRPWRPSAPARWLGWWLGRQPLRLLGFDFLLAQLRGDRRIRIGLLPLVAFPVALTLAGLVLSGGADPYVEAGPQASSLENTPGAALVLDPEAHRAPESEDPAAERHRGIVVLFMAIYMMAVLAATIGHGIGRSPDWRAAWVFHAAPLGRYDQFYAGVLWGVVYALVLPAAALVGLLLLVVWRDPAHVLAHVALPAGLAILGFPLGAAVHPEPPFTREPLRHTRGVRAGVSLLVSIPLLAVAALHYLVRAHLLLLVGAGLLCAGLGALVWFLTARRLRNAFDETAFEG